MSEFDFIKKYFSTLSKDKSASLDLEDDAAIINNSKIALHDLVISKDALVENIHFFKDTDPYLLAKKAIRTNLSDIASMGATPIYYLLSLVLPNKLVQNEDWISIFCKSLEEENKIYGIDLIGGDTVISGNDDNIVISITIIGKSLNKNNKFFHRFNAEIDDDIYVTGNIGDAKIGLDILNNKLNMVEKNEYGECITKYHIPIPRNDIAKILGEKELVHASIDISDGLLSDLNHIITNSNNRHNKDDLVSAKINIESIPISILAKKLVDQNKDYFYELITGGDDYELIFLAKPKFADDIAKIKNEFNFPITKIGKIIKYDNNNILLTDNNGSYINYHDKIKSLGYVHGISK